MSTSQILICIFSIFLYISNAVVPGEVNTKRELRRLRNAKRKFARVNNGCYNYQFSRSAFTFPCHLQSMNVLVIDDDITEVSFAEGNEFALKYLCDDHVDAYNQQLELSTLKIDDFYDLIQDTLNDNPYYLKVKYHEYIGIPLEIDINPVENIADDEAFYKINCFEFDEECTNRPQSKKGKKITEFNTNDKYSCRNINVPSECPSAGTLMSSDFFECHRFYDGCNTCSCDDKDIVSCTSMYCDEYNDPRCLECESNTVWDTCGGVCDPDCDSIDNICGIRFVQAPDCGNPRCQCPSDMPRWDGDKCITEKECNPISTTTMEPQVKCPIENCRIYTDTDRCRSCVCDDDGSVGNCRSDGECVPSDVDTCDRCVDDSMHFTECGGCTNTCKQFLTGQPIICASVCRIKCECNTDTPLYLAGEGRCISEDECNLIGNTPSPVSVVDNTCPVHCLSYFDGCNLCNCPLDGLAFCTKRACFDDLNQETPYCRACEDDDTMEWTTCGGCDVTCDNPNPICTLQCRQKCQCKIDTPIYDPVNKKCISKDECPAPPPPPTCSDITNMYVCDGREDCKYNDDELVCEDNPCYVTGPEPHPCKCNDNLDDCNKYGCQWNDIDGCQPLPNPCDDINDLCFCNGFEEDCVTAGCHWNGDRCVDDIIVKTPSPVDNTCPMHCVSYWDGCNTCSCPANGGLGYCTLGACPTDPPRPDCKACADDDTMEYTTCGGCDVTCDRPNPLCTLQCREKCQCKSDTPIYDPINEKCITIDECPPPPPPNPCDDINPPCSCSGNQDDCNEMGCNWNVDDSKCEDPCDDTMEYTTCGGCDVTCDRPNPICTLQCREKCQCKSDTPIYDPVNEKCITRDECPPPPPNPCDDINPPCSCYGNQDDCNETGCNWNVDDSKCEESVVPPDPCDDINAPCWCNDNQDDCKSDLYCRWRLIDSICHPRCPYEHCSGWYDGCNDCTCNSWPFICTMNFCEPDERADPSCSTCEDESTMEPTTCGTCDITCDNLEPMCTDDCKVKCQCKKDTPVYDPINKKCITKEECASPPNPCNECYCHDNPSDCESDVSCAWMLFDSCAYSNNNSECPYEYCLGWYDGCDGCTCEDEGTMEPTDCGTCVITCDNFPGPSICTDDCKVKCQCKEDTPVYDSINKICVTEDKCPPPICSDYDMDSCMDHSKECEWNDSSDIGFCQSNPCASMPHPCKCNDNLEDCNKHGCQWNDIDGCQALPHPCDDVTENCFCNEDEDACTNAGCNWNVDDTKCLDAPPPPPPNPCDNMDAPCFCYSIDDCPSDMGCEWNSIDTICQDAPISPSDEEIALANARATWQRVNNGCYRFQFSRSVFLPECYLQAYDVTIKDNKVDDVTFSKGDDSVLNKACNGNTDEFDESKAFGAKTIEDLFEIIEDGLNPVPDRVNIEYDVDTGVPLNIFIDPLEILGDDEIIYRVNCVLADSGCDGEAFAYNCDPPPTNCLSFCAW